MMRIGGHRLSLTLLSLLMLTLTGCGKAEFRMQFELSEAPADETLKVLYYASDSKRGMVVETVVQLTNGKGDIRCPSSYPTVVYLFRAGNRPTVCFYAERGDKISVTGKSNCPAEWRIGGNKLNDEWSQWRIANATALASSKPASINKAVADYVKSHTDNVLSMVLMLTTYSRSSDPAGYDRLWQMLGAKALNEQIFNAIGRADQIDYDINAPESVSSMQLHVVGDTLIKYSSADVPATLLYFRDLSTGMQKSAIDTLAKLARESRGRVIDVYFDVDSIAWKMALRRDTVNAGIVHAWAYGGAQNPAIAKLRVPTTPWYVVLNRKGVPVYSGSSGSTARNNYTKLTK